MATNNINTGTQGTQGPQGPQGPRGARGPSGLIGRIGLTGNQGPSGADGTSINFKGSLAYSTSLSTLSPPPVKGDAYFLSDSNEIHIFDGNDTWHNTTQLKGEQGISFNFQGSTYDDVSIQALNLGVNDAGKTYLASDTYKLYVWNGLAFTVSDSIRGEPGQPGGSATGPTNSVQVRNGDTTNGYDSFTYDNDLFTIGARNFTLNQFQIAIGNRAGSSQIDSISIGSGAGQNSQNRGTIAIGNQAGTDRQQEFAVAIGYQAGEVEQGNRAVAIGFYPGEMYQGGRAVAIGDLAGKDHQGVNAVAIGASAGKDNQADNSIVINATGAVLNNTDASTCVIKPIRGVPATDTSTNVLMYDTDTGEITVNTGSKTFVIDHPTDSNKYLVHACLEGPEAGVYYRGTGIINEGDKYSEIILADYVKHLATDYTVNVTPIYNEKENTFSNIAIKRVIDGKFKVYSDKPCEFDYVVFGKRNDIVVEPEKTNVEVKGDGPYKWL